MSAKNLIQANGRPAFGYQKETPSILNIEDYCFVDNNPLSGYQKWKVKNFRLKKWQFMGICHPDFILGAAVVSAGYIGNVFAYLFDRNENKIHEFTENTPFAAGIKIEGNPLEGSFLYKSRNKQVSMTNGNGKSVLKFALPKSFSADLILNRLNDPLDIITRQGLTGFNYTHKQSGLLADGFIRFGDKEYKLDSKYPCGILDYTFGLPGRVTFWNWASAGGLDQEGASVGFNFAMGINETGYNENCFWLDGKIYIVGAVHFDYDESHITHPWKIKSGDGSVDLVFKPLGERDAAINLSFIASQFKQPFGTFSGTLKAGKKIIYIDNLPGITEEHESKW